YNKWQMRLPGYGVVRETRKIDLQAGDNTVRFTDVASGIDPTTVSFQSLTAPDATSVLEQNYEYDVASADKLLEKYLGQELSISGKGDSAGKIEQLTGTLLSYDSMQLVLRPKDAPVELIPRNQDIWNIRLADSGHDLITKPTLVWKISTE